jgi:hypothetical protein
MCEVCGNDPCNCETPADIPSPIPAEQTPPEKATGGVPSSDPFDAISDSLIAGKPDAEECFIETMKKKHEQTEEGKKTAIVARDSSGVYFNPDVHKMDDQGRPLLTKRGLFELQRGRKRSEGKKKPPKLEEGATAEQQTAQTVEAAQIQAQMIAEKCEMTARTVAGLFWAMNIGFFGEEIGKPTQVESDMVPAALKEYYIQTGGGPDLPPWVAPLVILGGCLGRRVMHKKMEPRRKKWLEVARFFLWRVTGGRIGSPPEQEEKAEGKK